MAASTAMPARPKEALTFAIPDHGINYVVPMAAVALGFFDEVGLDVRIETMPSNLTVAALQRGDLQISGSGGSAVRAAVQGAPLTLVSFLTVRPNFYLLTLPEVRSPAQLAGKRIATNNVGSSQQNFVELYARAEGVDPGQIVFVGMGPNLLQSLAAMQAGALDGAVFDSGVAALAESQGFYPLKSLGEVAPEPLQGMVANDEYLEKHPDAVRAFLTGIVRGLRFAKQQPQDLAAVARRELALDMDDALLLRAVQLYVDNISAEAPGYADAEGMAAFYHYDVRLPLQLPADQPIPTKHDFRYLLAAYDALGIPRPR